MASVTCVMMDVVTEKSGHQVTPLAVSVCITPAAPSPLPLPYPVVASVAEGISDTPMRTKVDGSIFATTGSVLKTCHGNEPGTLKEVVSLNTTGPVFPIMGAPTVLAELGMVTITGSPCQSNKAPTPGAGGSASDASGTGSAGNGGGSDGSGDGNGQDAQNQNGGGGSGDDGTANGASATPPTANTPPGQDRYCPDANRRHPPPHEALIEDSDLRNHGAAIGQHASPEAKSMAMHAIHGVPGGATPTQGQAFWSGGQPAMDAARRDGYTIQEDSGGAAHLAAHDGTLTSESAPGANDGWNLPQGSSQSPVTRERLWRTVSRRSAENSSGTVDAFVVGTARPGNVFSEVELPTLLHNPNVDRIRFRNPAHQPPPAPVVSEWARQPDGCWQGGPTPTTDNGRGPVPGFQLHPTNGIVRT